MSSIAPVLGNLGGDATTFVSAAIPHLLDAGGDATVGDADSLDFAGGSLTVSIIANEVYSEDVLGIIDGGSLMLSDGPNAGSQVFVDGTEIGAIAVTGVGGNDFVILFNASATSSDVEVLIHALIYGNTNTINPTIASRSIAITLTDGDGGSTTETVTVNMAGANGDPVATDDAMSVTQRQSAAGNVITSAPPDSDPEDDVLTVTAVSFSGATQTVANSGDTSINGAHGTLTFAADGSYTYASNGEGDVAVGASVSDAFTYTVSDGSSTDTAQLLVTVVGSAIGDGGANIFLLTGPGISAAGLGGDDLYIVDNAGDTVTEANVAGVDTVNSSVSFALGTQFIENLTLLGSANINATGNNLANVLIGNSGNNTLNGNAAADTMQGMAGNDLYGVDNAGDIVDESVAGSGGVDSVNATVTVSLADAAHFKGDIENVTLLGAANINATGNALANLLIGNSGANALDGGAGGDTLRGLAGDDSYTVDNAGDVVDEAAAGSAGTDIVNASVTVSLADAVHFKGSIENVTLLGTGNINATGNALANVLTGNSGANTLDGGTGADTMIGLAGNDVYGVREITDVVDESVAGSAGIDRINSLVNVSLVQVANAAIGKGGIEAITLLGTADIFAYGNALANVIVGNSGSNVIAAGLGNDTLTGAGGNDFFLFNTALNATSNVDTITDLNETGDDTIRLENAIFTTLTTPGALAAGAFVISTTGATDADDRIIYNNVNGQLSYDADGNGAGAAIRFAQLDTGLGLTAADFAVV